MKRFQRMVALAVLGLSLLAGIAAAQESARQEPQIVRWQVEFADGTRAKLMGQIGDVNRVTRQDGSVIAFSPLKDRKTGEVRLRVSEVVADPKKTEVFRTLAEIPVNNKAETVTRVTDFTVKILPAPAGPKPARNEVNGIPLSDRVIRWEMTLSDGRVIRLAVLEGEMARLKMADGQTYGLVPVLRADQQDRIEFRLFSVSRQKGLGESLRLQESFGLEEGGDYFPSVWDGSLIKISRAYFREVPAGTEKLSVEPIETDNGCCVTCGGTRACGCAVSMDCGDCCSPPCCWEAY